ncbi:hypothetical protein BC939DRAFT_468022 [Gamsiella multidivaricata]|uniref:uncharacterized protein n=1 Tax=Gamsiella multidivaricata TaxID=101098 RepID=UPI00221FCEBB|nr:uncharacterized protein BC939DRAFT_468022 [Gamsiella multidivaricata]KAI7816757.1 hypothetical protein BC939DRAFT_468022 [Gamsiella multidivaricata]
MFRCFLFFFVIFSTILHCISSSFGSTVALPLMNIFTGYHGASLRHSCIIGFIRRNINEAVLEVHKNLTSKSVCASMSTEKLHRLQFFFRYSCNIHRTLPVC